MEFSFEEGEKIADEERVHVHKHTFSIRIKLDGFGLKQCHLYTILQWMDVLFAYPAHRQ